MANFAQMLEQYGHLMNLGSRVDFLPTFQCEAMLKEFARIKHQDKKPSTSVHEATSFIWRHQPATKDVVDKKDEIVPERSFIDVRFCDKYYYQLILTQTLEEGKPITTIVGYINKERCEIIIDARPAVEVAHEWVAGLLRLFDYTTIDIAPPCINLLKIELQASCKTLDIRGYWDSSETDIIGSWLNGFKLVVNNLNVWGGPSPARIKHSRHFKDACNVKVHGLSDVDNAALLRRHGLKTEVYGTTLQNVTGCVLNDVIPEFKKSTFKREMTLEGCLEPNFQQRIIEQFRAQRLLDKCTYNTDLNELYLCLKDGINHLIVDVQQNYAQIRYGKMNPEELKKRKR